MIIFPGFPMSAYLRGRKFWLGRNAKILAAQPLTRLAEKAALPSTSLLWRAILQVYISVTFVNFLNRI
jgi:hypothetical protein